MKKVASGSYWWIERGRKRWNVWMGNPLCVGCFRVARSTPLEKVVAEVERIQKKERTRFRKGFKLIPWQDSATWVDMPPKGGSRSRGVQE